MFDSKEEWEADINKRARSKISNSNWIAIHAKPAKIKTTTTIAVDIE